MKKTHTKSRILNNFIFSIFIILLLGHQSYTDAASNRTFEKIRLQLSNEIGGVLVSHSLCANISACASKQFFFVSPESWGLEVELYGLTEDKILSEIITLCSTFFLREKGEVNFRVKIFNVSKREQLNSGVFNSTKAQLIIFKGE